jgi:hypothetical protein
LLIIFYLATVAANTFLSRAKAKHGHLYRRTLTTWIVLSDARMEWLEHLIIKTWTIEIKKMESIGNYRVLGGI